MKRIVVDRIESGTAVLVDDDGAEYELPSIQLPKPCRSEGAVLSVPEGAGGALDWKNATRDVAAEKHLLTEAEARLQRLRRRDPGGDINL